MIRYMTAGESHGKGEVTILEGVPAGLKIDKGFIDNELARRMAGYGRGKRMEIEQDRVEIVAGCRKGVTIGSPIGMLVPNKDFKIDELHAVKCPRPGHADLAGMQKYGMADARDVLERASARETAARVSAGAVAKLILKEFDIRILSHVTMLGGAEAKTEGLSFEDIYKLAYDAVSRLRCADRKAEEAMCGKIDEASRAGDTLGGSFEVIVRGVPAGLGSYVQWDRRMDGAIARAVMSIPAVKAVSIGQGIECSMKKGSETHDPIKYDAGRKTFGRLSNNAGGIEGGVTNGMDVVVKGFMKPIATLASPLRSVDIDTKHECAAATERSDVTAVPACGVIAESVVALEIASAFLEKFGGDSMKELTRNYNGYMEQLRAM
ncbi:MAG: chorismate synthase [Candidatus Omnitrophota bacterium]